MRVLLAHDEGLMLAGLRQALETDQRFVIVAEVHTGADALEQLDETAPDVVLLGARIRGVDALGYLLRIRDRRPDVSVVVCSPSPNGPVLERALAHGAVGYIVESMKPSDVGQTIIDAVGVARLPPPLPAHVMPAAESALTAREHEVLEAVSHGLSNQAIASELSITVQTVKYHLTRIYRKLGVSNRTEATRVILSRQPR